VERVYEAGLPWDQVAGVRNRLAHRHFDTSHAILQATVDEGLPTLKEAVQNLLELAKQR
jgi:uncharacterized protein with HEPN domain